MKQENIVPSDFLHTGQSGRMSFKDELKRNLSGASDTTNSDQSLHKEIKFLNFSPSHQHPSAEK